MTRKELIERVRRHEAQCDWSIHTSFTVVAVVELAGGVIAVCDTDREYTLYYDKSKVQFDPGSRFDNGNPRDFPSDTGFITEVSARSWEQIGEVAKLALKTSTRRKVRWHKKPIKIKY